MPFLDHNATLPPDSSWRLLYKTTPEEVSHEGNIATGGTIVVSALALGALYFIWNKPEGYLTYFIAAWVVFALGNVVYWLAVSRRDADATPLKYQGVVRGVYFSWGRGPKGGSMIWIKLDDLKLSYPRRSSHEISGPVVTLFRKVRSAPSTIEKEGQELVVSYLPGQKIILESYVRDRANA